MDDNFFERIAQAFWANDNGLAVYLQQLKGCSEWVFYM